MAAFMLRRLLSAVPVLIGASLIVFSLMLLMPGDPAVGIGGEFASEQRIEQIRVRLGLDDPPVVRYWNWISDFARGDFGESAVNGTPIASELWRRLGVTLQLAAGALVTTLLFGVPVAVIQASNRDRWPDTLLRFMTSLGLAIPNFLLAALLILVFAVSLGWLPSQGYVRFAESPADWLRHLILPVVTLGVLLACVIARQLRAGLVNIAESEYMRTARAKGLSSRRIVWKHQLKNAAAPALVVFGVSVAHLLAGAVVVEVVFGLPGLGRYTITAITSRDVPVVQAIAMLSAALAVITSMAVDALLALLNPKVRLSA